MYIIIYVYFLRLISLQLSHCFEEHGFNNYRYILIIFLYIMHNYLENLFPTVFYRSANTMKMNTCDMTMRRYLIGNTPMSEVVPGEWAGGCAI